MSIGPVDSVLTWSGSRRGLAFSEPLSLRAHAGERLEIEVQSEQTALVVAGGEVVATLSSDRHFVAVLETGDETGTHAGPRALPCSGVVIYVSRGPLPVMEWGQGASTPFHDAGQGPVELGIEGFARLRVAGPGRFYRSFLRNTEDLPAEQLEIVAATLLRACLVRSLGRRAARWAELPCDPATLTESVRGDLTKGMAAVGLDLLELQITRVELPTGVTRVPTAPRSRGTLRPV